MTITSCQTNNDALNFCYNENKIELTEAEISSIMFDDEVKLTKDEAVDIFNLFAEDNLTTRQNDPVIKIEETKEYNISPSNKLQNQVNNNKLHCPIYGVENKFHNRSLYSNYFWRQEVPLCISIL